MRKETRTVTMYPFEVPFDELRVNIKTYVEVVFKSLQSSFLILPRGPGFVEYPDFQDAYEVLKRCTRGFERFDMASVWEALEEDALVYMVLRSILGLSPPELAHLASVEKQVVVAQRFARSLDRRIRDNRRLFQTMTVAARERVAAMVEVAGAMITSGPPELPPDVIHRLDKADTRSGVQTLRSLAQLGVPYAMLLYERYLGRPFAGHRDAVSELVGQVMENAVEDQLIQAGVSYRKTKRAEKIEGFDQAPDFVVPDEWNTSSIIEAKITEDDGTARDKVTRIQHLAEISRAREQRGLSGFEVIACVDGRGFGVRREDMRKLLEATQGKVFTLSTIDRLVDHTSLSRFRSS